MPAIALDVMIDEAAADRMIGPTVDVPAVRALAVGRLLVQLERGVRTDVLDVLVALGRLETTRIVRVTGRSCLGPWITANGQILVPIRLVLQIGQRRRLRYRGRRNSILVAVLQLWNKAEQLAIPINEDKY